MKKDSRILDKIDRNILRILQEDASMSIADVAAHRDIVLAQWQRWMVANDA